LSHNAFFVAQSKADAMREHTEEEQKKARERAEQTAARIITMSLGRSTERAWSAWTMYMADVHKHADNAKRSVCPPLPPPSRACSGAFSSCDARRFREQAQIKRTKCVCRHVAPPRPRAIV
jgi:hypothetical protein